MQWFGISVISVHSDSSVKSTAQVPSQTCPLAFPHCFCKENSCPFLVCLIFVTELFPALCWCLATLIQHDFAQFPKQNWGREWSQSASGVPEADPSGTWLDLINLYNWQCFEIILCKNLAVFFHMAVQWVWDSLTQLLTGRARKGTINLHFAFSLLRSWLLSLVSQEGQFSNRFPTAALTFLFLYLEIKGQTSNHQLV